MALDWQEHGCFLYSADWNLSVVLTTFGDKQSLKVAIDNQEIQRENKVSRKITAIKVQKRNPQRVNIYLDGEYALGLSRIVAGWLEVGQELSDDKIAALQAEDSREAAYQKALKLLSYRARSQAEIQDYLRKGDMSQDIIDEVLERLRSNGLVDDERFAQTWVENRNDFRPRGRPVLAMELRQQGIAQDIIDETLSGIDEEDLAYRAGLKQARKWKGLPRPEFRRKMVSFLARRGFSYDIIAPAVDRIWIECRSD